MGIDFDKYYEMNKFSKSNKQNKQNSQNEQHKGSNNVNIPKVEQSNNYERKFVNRDRHHAKHNENNLKNLIKQYGEND